MSREPRNKRKLVNSPLIVVLTEIRFAPILAMGNLVPEIQESLRRKGFPGFATSVVQQFQLSLAGGEPTLRTASRWVFTSTNRDHTITLTTEGVSFQTTAYDDFEGFLEFVSGAVDVVASIAEPSFADRVGLRYVDAIPNVGEQMSRYFNETVLTFSAADLEVQSLLLNQHIVATTEHGHLQIRLNQVENAPLLPPDLNSPELASVGSSRPGVHAILDIDSADERRTDFDWATLEARLWGVHKHAGTAFWKSVTPEALSVWGEQTGASE